MKKGDKIEMGNGFVFHVVSENQAEKACIGFLKHKSEVFPIGQTSINKTFLEKFKKTSEERIADANLIVDTGNTIQSCGLLPSQLLKQNNEMRAFLNKINYDYEAFSDLNSHGYGEELEKLIESTNP